MMPYTNKIISHKQNDTLSILKRCSLILKIKLRNKSSKIKYLDLKYTIEEKFLRSQQTLSDG